MPNLDKTSGGHFVLPWLSGLSLPKIHNPDSLPIPSSTCNVSMKASAEKFLAMPENSTGVPGGMAFFNPVGVPRRSTSCSVTWGV